MALSTFSYNDYFIWFRGVNGSKAYCIWFSNDGCVKLGYANDYKPGSIERNLVLTVKTGLNTNTFYDIDLKVKDNLISLTCDGTSIDYTANDLQSSGEISFSLLCPSGRHEYIADIKLAVL